MRAAVCPAVGPPEILEIRQIPTPELQSGQARVEVTYAAVNFPDVLVMAGEYQIKVPAPFVPGSEFAGVVTEVADDVTSVAVGDRVAGTGIVGAFAEQICAQAAGLRQIPDSISDDVAAAAGVAHRTAYHCLRSVARVKPGDAVIVLGAGGGVGLAAVQLAVALGATVIAVASSDEKLSVAADHGATEMINHRTTDLRAAMRDLLPDGAAAVIDPVGGDLSEPALRSLGRGGRFVTIGYASGTIPRIPLNLVLVKGLQVLGFGFQDLDPDEFGRNESELADLLIEGTALPYVGATYPLDETAAALRTVADGRAIGKILIKVAR